MPVITPALECHTGAKPIDEVELYTLDSSSAQFRLTPHEFDVHIHPGGHSLYESCPIERSALALGAEASKSALELKLPPDHTLVRHLLEAAIIGETTVVRLHMARRADWGESWSLSGTRWMGRVLGVEVATDAARIRCESAQVSLKRIGLRRLYSRACSHVLYSAACKASPLSGTATVSDISGRIVTLHHIPAAVHGALAAGWLETTNGRRYMIIQAGIGFDVELLSVPIGLKVGDSVTLVAGCDHTMATCRARFDNLDNFGGFPYIPSKNPFSTGIF